MVQDVKDSFRVLRNRPQFVAVTVLTLALGIGANVAVFSAIRAVLLDQPPYPEAERIVRLSIPVRQLLPDPLMLEDLEAIRGRSHVFATVGACTWATVNVRGGGDVERVEGPWVTPEFFDVFGVGPLIGRTFTPEEHAARAHVTLLSYDVWRSQFGGAADVVGRTIAIDREPWTVIGVMPPTFGPQCRGTETGGVWRPYVPKPDSRAADLRTYARLAPGVTLEAARHEIDALRSAQATVSLGAYGARVEGLNDAVARNARPGLLLLQTVAAFLLLITCANLANLFLAHGSARQHELGIRSALGAGRWRLMRRLLTEAGLIATAGSLIGVALAFLIVPRLVLAAPGRLGVVPPGTVLTVRWSEFALGLVAGWMTALLFGIVPAWVASKVDVLQALRATRQMTPNRFTKTLRAGLVAAEVLLAVVVLTGTTLLLRSFAHVLNLSMGFEPRGVVVANLYDGGAAAASADMGLSERFEAQLQRRFGAAPVALAAAMPFAGFTRTTDFAVGPSPGEKPVWRWSEGRLVSPSYFATLRVPVLRGRLLTADDARAQPGRVVVNEAFARKFFGGVDVLGRSILRHVRSFSDSEPAVIVGVVPDARSVSLLGPPNEAVYSLLADHGIDGSFAVAVRAPLTPSIERTIREAARAASPEMAVLRVASMDALIAQSETRRRFYLTMLLAFGGLAALLATVGVYAVMSQMVGQRMRELGIRIALGARIGDVRRLVVGSGLTPVAIGLAGGAIAAWWIAGLLGANGELRYQLFDVPPQDPFSIAATAALLLGAALVACWIPANRTKRIDPIEILRTD